MKHSISQYFFNLYSSRYLGCWESLSSPFFRAVFYRLRAVRSRAISGAAWCHEIQSVNLTVFNHGWTWNSCSSKLLGKWTTCVAQSQQTSFGATRSPPGKVLLGGIQENASLPAGNQGGSLPKKYIEGRKRRHVDAKVCMFTHLHSVPT